MKTHLMAMRLACRRFVMVLASAVVGIAIAASAPAHAQGEPQFSTWEKVEGSDDAKKYFDQIKKGEFDAGSKAFLERIALPQLAAEGNRKKIEQRRRRMRDVLLNEKTTEATALDKASKTAVDWLVAQARNPQAEPVVRVNAMLLVGEIRGKDGRPWNEAIGPLATVMGDAALPAAVRVAAAAGLAKHVEATKAAGTPDPGLAQAATKPLLAVIASPASAADGAAGDWLVSRALDMLPTVVGKSTPETAAALMAILADGGRPIDVRVRAAAALGATATTTSNVDAGDAVAKIRSLAAEALKADIASAMERALTARMSGQPMMPMASPGSEGMMPPGFPGAGGEFGAGATVEDPIDSLVVRRDAWRLMTLATAVATADGTAGLASLLADDAAARAKGIAQTLRESAISLDQSPDAAAMKQAFAAIERTGQAAGSRAPAATKPAATPATEPAAGSDPFGAGN
jgi:hypothetical protein